MADSEAHEIISNLYMDDGKIGPHNARQIIQALAKRGFQIMAARKREQVFCAKTTDGRAVTIRHSDKGDIIPGIDKDHRRYEAYTSYLQYDWGKHLGDFVPLGFVQHNDRYEEYVQVQKHLADASGDPEAYRLKYLMAAFESHGINTATIEDVA